MTTTTQHETTTSLVSPLWTLYDQRPGYRPPADPFTRTRDDSYFFSLKPQSSLNPTAVADKIQDLVPTILVKTHEGKIIVSGIGSGQSAVLRQLHAAQDIVARVEGTAASTPFAEKHVEGFSFIVTPKNTLSPEAAAQQIKDLFPIISLNNEQGEITISGKGTRRETIWLDLLDAADLISSVNGFPTTAQRHQRTAKPAVLSL